MNHTQISVEANGQTIKTNKGTFYSFNENGKTYEQQTFKNEADSTIIEFIANHKNVEANFSYQKNEKYDDFGRFVHATQTNERNNEKNYLVKNSDYHHVTICAFGFLQFYDFT